VCPDAARNKRSHWIATARDEDGTQMVYDINIGEWVPRILWGTRLMPELLRHWKASG